MSIINRLAGAPISWGVCEVPGWGIELPPDRVLGEMRELGLVATELGSDGYLPTEPEALRQYVSVEHELELIGGFVPVVVHEPSQEQATIDATHRAASLMAGANGTLFISSAVTTWDWDARQPVSPEGWRHAAHMFSVIDDILDEYGMVQALHPHLGTIVETYEDVHHVLDSSEVGWTLDIGHLMIGGTDPLQFIDDAFSRIRHVHLKDVDLALAAPVFAGEQSIMEGVQAGMFTNLGQGDVPVAESIQSLEALGYDQWYVLEQDAAITGPMPEVGSGPILDVQTSIEFLRTVDAGLPAPHASDAAERSVDAR